MTEKLVDRYLGSPAKSKSISHEIQRIILGITENIINEFLPKIVSLIYDKNKNKYGR